MHKKITFFIIVFIGFITSAQTVTTITDGGFMDGLAQDAAGNIYGSDWGGNTVYKYDTNGNVSVFKNGFTNPNGIAINSAGEIYICDHGAWTIYKYDANGNLLSTFGSSLFRTPAGIKRIPNTEDMLVVEYGTEFNPSTNSAIKKLAADGTVTTLSSGNVLNGPAGIAYIGDVAYIANYNNRKIFRFDGSILTEIAQLPAGAASNNVLGFMSAINGELIATQIGEHKIYKINPTSGAITLYAGSVLGNSDGDLNSATFNLPNGILGDDTNNRIYISDAGTKNLRIINNAVLSVDTNQLLKVEVTAYPNPNKDSLNIKLSGFETSQIQLSVLDVNGKELFKKECENSGGNFQEKITTSG